TQQARLLGVLDELASGRGRSVLVAGEAGMGKSRLVTYAREEAAARGIALVQGTCFENDSARPYAPFAGLLRDVAGRTSNESPIPVAESDAAVFLAAFPELALWLPAASPASRLDPEQEKRRLMQAVEHFLLSAAQAGPLVVVLEDLHWCDESSLELVLQLA